MILGIGAAVGAYFASGILRVAFIVVAVLLGALIAWDVLVAAFGTILMWSLKLWVDRTRARNRRSREAQPPGVT